MVFAYQSLGYFILKGKTNIFVFTNGSYLLNTLSFCQYFWREGIIQSVTDRRKKKFHFSTGKGGNELIQNSINFPSFSAYVKGSEPAITLFMPIIPRAHGILKCMTIRDMVFEFHFNSRRDRMPSECFWGAILCVWLDLIR